MRPVGQDVETRRSLESDENGEMGWVSYYRATATFDVITAALSEAKL